VAQPQQSAAATTFAPLKLNGPHGHSTVMAIRLPRLDDVVYDPDIDVVYDLAVLQANVDSLVSSSDKVDAQGALYLFCRQGDIAAVTWLVDRFALTADDARSRNNSALRCACQGGHQTTAAWLADRFNLTTRDVRGDSGAAFKLACEGGHLSTAVWLAGWFDMTAEVDHCASFQLACEFATTEWLVDRFGMTAADARSDNCCALRWACMSGHPDVVRFLLAPPPVGLGATPPQALAQELFLDAVGAGAGANSREVALVLAAHAGLDNACQA
jgi:Ankyrin repeat